MASPKVTVLVDTYNHERFIEEAIVSVMEQDFPAAEMEILVVDDGSTDRTPDLVRKFEPRVRLLRKANGGQASAFNAGVSEARGELVAFLDGDDWWARNKLTRVAKAMAADSAVGIVGHGIVIVHRDGRQEDEILREGFRFQANTREGARLFRLRRSFLGTSRMTIRAELLRRIGPVPQALRIQADEYLFTLASALAGGCVLPQALTNYRYHEANSYQLARADSTRIRAKQEAIAELARVLSVELERHGIGPEAREAITEILAAEADQLRLQLSGGMPVETVRTEWKIYDVHYPQAPWLHRAFKRLSLLPAFLLPPRTYYRWRSRMVQSRLYRDARGKFLPNPPRRHVTNRWAPKPEASRPATAGRQ
ncbi:MAG TPA: glycosyltransferase family A protein [Candidatus Sulfotelmatobacter sp.]|nr:glycosyltransferase family A protein [Candidatus Sulfotelmatobacter sp.]